jgi:hypothetical protein
MVNKNSHASGFPSLPDREMWYTEGGTPPLGKGPVDRSENHGSTFAGTQLPAMPSFLRVLGSPLSPGLHHLQNQKPKAAQPRGLPRNWKTLPGFREIPEDQIAMNQ